jgi:putative membrane protein
VDVDTDRHDGLSGGLGGLLGARFEHNGQGWPGSAEARVSEVALNKQAGQAVRSIAYPGVAVGLALFTAIIGYEGVGEIGAALAGAGAGLLVVAMFHLVPLLTNAIGWRCLLAGVDRQPLGALVWARWISESVNGLLPVVQMGGNVVRAQLIARRGVPGATAGASVVVDITANVAAQIVFTLLGLCLLVVHVGSRQLAAPALLGLVIMAVLLGGFFVAQRRGLFGGAVGLWARFTRTVGTGSAASEAAALDAAVARLYGERAVIAAAMGWHLVSWIAGAGEVWLALYFLGQPVGVFTALLIESLGQVIRTAAFVVPGALGVQEGGYLVLGKAFGISPETAVALSLAKRVRELLFGLPGLVAWQLQGAAGLLRPQDV